MLQSKMILQLEEQTLITKAINEYEWVSKCIVTVQQYIKQNHLWFAERAGTQSQWCTTSDEELGTALWLNFRQTV